MICVIENENSESIESVFYEFDMAVSEAIHEYRMSVVTESYNYLCETGANDPKEAVKGKNFLARAINAVINAIKKVYETISRKIKNIFNRGGKKTASKLSDKLDKTVNKQIENVSNATDSDDLKEKSDEAKKQMQDLSNDVKNIENGLKDSAKKAEEAGVDPKKILKNKEDVDNYFQGDKKTNGVKLSSMIKNDGSMDSAAFDRMMRDSNSHLIID